MISLTVGQCIAAWFSGVTKLAKSVAVTGCNGFSQKANGVFVR